MLTKHNMYIFLKIFSILIPSKNLRKKYRDSISYFLFKPTKSEIENVCHMMSNKQTIEYIVSNNCSYCRYGDGEIGYMLNENFQHFFQPQNAILRQKLKYILENPIENCIIGIPIWIKEAKNQLYKKFQVSYWRKFVPFLKGDVNYGCAHTFSQNAFLNEENYPELLKKNVG